MNIQGLMGFCVLILPLFLPLQVTKLVTKVILAQKHTLNFYESYGQGLNLAFISHKGPYKSCLVIGLEH